MYKLKKINIWSLSIMVAVIQFIFGVLIAVFSLLIKLNPEMASMVNPALLTLTPLQIILIYPLSNLLGGFLMALLIGLLYNLLVPRVGGISFDLVQVVAAKKKEAEPKKEVKETSKKEKDKKK
jgi:hypothetical protein